MSTMTDGIRDLVHPELFRTEYAGLPKMHYDFRPAWHQLVIIGNGFDLECGLHSGFGSFIKDRDDVFANEAMNDGANPLGDQRTLWDVVLKALGDADWCDVETAISQWIVPGDSSSSRRPLIDDVLADLEILGDDWKSNPQNEASAIAYYLAQSPEQARRWTRESLIEFSREELRKFKQDFAKYLKHQQDVTSDYRENARKTIIELLLNGRPAESEFDIEESVLSFNYTRPVKKLNSKTKLTTYVNIHGQLSEDEGTQSDIIFGIDGTGRMDNPEVMPFTKTYRLMALGTANSRNIVHTPATIGSMDYGTDLIKFYGHSLGEADYSYFQAIFDAVHLYDGHTRLIFYYRRHSKEEKTEREVAEEMREIKTDMMRRVVKLLTAYGNTLDNKDHGKNLIHKLLIEGRLAVLVLQ
ncbi:MAG: hypothetical protein ACFWTL_06510 [Atopobium sp.]